MHLKPAQSLYTKAWMTFGTITAYVLIVTGVATLVINLATDDPGSAVPVGWIVVGSVLAGLWLIGAPITWLWIRNLSYEVTDDAIIIRKGIRAKVDEHIPFRMITDFRLHRSLYDRWLHIGSIDVQTAGTHHTATGYEGRLSGQLQPERLHEELRNKIRKVEPTRIAGNGGGADLHAMLEELREIHHLLER